MKQRSDGAAAHALWIIFGGMALIALPVAAFIARGPSDFSGFMMGGISILTLAGPAVASTVFRVLRPDAVIYEELISGERFVVERSMKRRRMYAGIAIAIYAVGAALVQL